MLSNFSFLHIPKNGGTAIETIAQKLNIELVVAPPWVNRKQIFLNISNDKKPPFNWHLPPDLFEEYYKVSRSPNKKEILCIVREPKDRLISIIRHMMTMKLFKKVMKQVHDELHKVVTCKYRKEILKQSLHLIPQHWYVWSEKGRRQCDCVVSYDKMKYITTKKVKVSYHSFNKTHIPKLPSVFDLDYALWHNATKSSSFCYRANTFINI